MTDLLRTPRWFSHSLLAAGLLFAFFLSLPGALAARRGNVLVIVADDLGVDKLRVYGEGILAPPTPNISLLAQRGVLFRNCWSNPNCSPTRAGMYTGRHAFRHGVGTAIVFGAPLAARDLAPREVLLPEVLRRVGISNALIGKWHLGRSYFGDYQPNVMGWMQFSGGLNGAVEDYFRWEKTVNGTTTTSTRYATTEQVDDAIAWIEARRGPWCCVLSFNAPHVPHHAPPDDLHSYDLDGLAPSDSSVPHYNAMVQAMDTEIGRLFKTLGARLANTTIIFAGDNGSYGPIVLPPFDSMRAKTSVYEGGVNVPLIIAGAMVETPGREEKALVHTVDLFATIAEIGGADASSGSDSVSLLPYLENAEQEPLRETVFTEVFSPVFGAQAAIRDDRYKLIRDNGEEEFYDLTADPFEKNNLIDSPDAQVQQRYAALLAEMNLLLASNENGRATPHDLAADPPSVKDLFRGRRRRIRR